MGLRHTQVNLRTVRIYALRPFQQRQGLFVIAPLSGLFRFLQ
jgi:hypothetical protein